MTFKIRRPSILLQHLHYCLAAYEHGSIRRAADTLLVKQSMSIGLQI